MTNVEARYHDLLKGCYERSAYIGGIVLVNEGVLVASALPQDYDYDSETIGTITSSTKEIIENNYELEDKLIELFLDDNEDLSPEQIAGRYETVSFKTIYN